MNVHYKKVLADQQSSFFDVGSFRSVELDRMNFVDNRNLQLVYLIFHVLNGHLETMEEPNCFNTVTVLVLLFYDHVQIGSWGGRRIQRRVLNADVMNGCTEMLIHPVIYF